VRENRIYGGHHQLARRIVAKIDKMCIIEFFRDESRPCYDQSFVSIIYTRINWGAIKQLAIHVRALKNIKDITVGTADPFWPVYTIASIVCSLLASTGFGKPYSGISINVFGWTFTAQVDVYQLRARSYFGVFIRTDKTVILRQVFCRISTYTIVHERGSSAWMSLSTGRKT
jgi:hypothetical protein